MTRALALILFVSVSALMAGCASDAGKATEEDKKAITNMVENGIGTGPPGSTPTGAAEPPPASGQVDKP